MPKNPEKAQKLKEKKERKALELAMKQSREKVEEAKLLMDPTEPKVAPNFPKAIQTLDNALQLWDANCDAFRLRGECHREQRNYDSAIEDFTAALAIDEENVPGLEGRASCFMALHRWDNAAADYTRMIQVAPQLDHAFNMRATAKLAKRAQGLRLRNAELTAVVEDFMQAQRLNPNNFHATCNLARCYDEHGMHEEAIGQYTAALKLKDDYTYAMYRRAVVALALVESRREAAAAEAAKKAAAEAKLAKSGAAPATSAAPAEPSDAEIQAAIEAERKAEEALAVEQRLLTDAVNDLSRVIPLEDPQNELPSVLHRAACNMYLGLLDKSSADMKVAAEHLDPLKGESLAEASFAGTSAVVLKDVYAIRKKELDILRQRERGQGASIRPS